MPLIPVFKKCKREDLIEKWQLEFPISDWVSVVFPYKDIKVLDKSLENDAVDNEDEEIEYEVNRYDVKYFDKVTGNIISIYLYMNEDSNEIIAIDSVVQDCINTNVSYPMEETPFNEILKDIKQV